MHPTRTGNRPVPGFTVSGFRFMRPTSHSNFVNVKECSAQLLDELIHVTPFARPLAKPVSVGRKVQVLHLH